MATIVIDAGHGGFDNGARYQERREKDDNLRLALAVGQILKQQGYDVIYTRTTDIYQSPFDKAQIANDAGADYFISFHRNSSENDNTYHGVQTLIYGGDEQAERLAESINAELEKAGFTNLGIEERTGLVVLRRTEMPAVLIETGFLNSDRDNEIFDNNFEEIASAIAMGIEQVIPVNHNTSMDYEEMNEEERGRVEPFFDENKEDDKEEKCEIFSVEVGRFAYRTTANYLAEELDEEGFQSYVLEEDGIFHVTVGREASLEDALNLQRRLREAGYQTMIIAAE